MAGRVVVSTLNNDTGVLATQNGMTGIAKAWVNFNGSTAAIRGAFNVSSVTRVSTGVYTVNFTTNMADTNYAAMSGFQTPAWPAVTHQYVYAVGSVKVECAAGAGPTYYDPSIFTVAIFSS